MKLKSGILFFVAVCLAGCVDRSNERSSNDSDDQQEQQTASSKEGHSFSERRKLGDIEYEKIDESSGLTASLNHPNLYWTHNDNGMVAGLFLVDLNGKTHAHIQVANAEFRDWEDIDSFSIDGRNFLVIGDVGDNQRKHETCRLFVFEEPNLELSTDKPLIELTVEQAAVVEFRYPEGPRDCEAMSVDTASRTFMLISKRIDPDATANPTTVHSLPLQTTATAEPIMATRVETDFQQAMVTGLDISDSGQIAIVRSYTTVWMYAKSANESWGEGLSRPVSRTLAPLQRQGEAICFSHDGKSALLTSEGINRPIWQIDLSAK